MKNYPSSGNAFLSLIGLLMLLPVNPARAEGIPLKNAGFELEGTGGIPQDWKTAAAVPASGTLTAMNPCGCRRARREN